MLINIPIESLEERYSQQWNSWFPEEFTKHDFPFITIHPTPLTNKIERGSFLDVAATNYFKATQNAVIASMFYKDEITDGDVLFFHDIWHPGLEAAAYMRDGLNRDVKICGCIFAGTYDPYDFTFKRGMGYWGKDLENSWFKILDKIFVATEFHKRLILEHREVPNRTAPKENIVVFPHRLDSEKNPHLFNELETSSRMKGTDYKFIKTKEVCHNKREYYDLLQKSKIAVSFAEQETFGFAMIEAVFADCLVLVPDALAYAELYESVFKYTSKQEGVHLLSTMMEAPFAFEEARVRQKKKLELIGSSAIGKMIKEIKSF